jgi:hypothetical protein
MLLSFNAIILYPVYVYVTVHSRVHDTGLAICSILLLYYCLLIIFSYSITVF